MSKTTDIKTKYLADTELMASKARFGYFSILPSHTAAVTDCKNNYPNRNPDGKVQTSPRNIFSGITSTGSLRKNYFSYVPSAFHGSAFQDPGKHQRKQQVDSSKKWADREIYKPAKLNNTLTKASYEYISPNDPKKPPKRYRNSEGKVITQSCNVLTSPQTKIEFQKIKNFKYTECLLPEKKQQKQVSNSGKHDDAFRTGISHKQVFVSHVQTYYDANIQKKELKKVISKAIDHDAAFRPSCTSPGKPFIPIIYQEEGKGKEKVTMVKKQNNTQDQPFKLTKVEYSSKPTPSISCSKINVLRGYR